MAENLQLVFAYILEGMLSLGDLTSSTIEIEYRSIVVVLTEVTWICTLI